MNNEFPHGASGAGQSIFPSDLESSGVQSPFPSSVGVGYDKESTKYRDDDATCG